ncbi:MAG: DEAD/DEAH box helicase, partial [Planctomycetota bacterium]|nr:DEAD/DEAH box helicase [Planctomycetota bacterium]
MAENTAPASFLSSLGLKEFRPGQKEVVDAVTSGKDVMCVMPTGGGKSLCYQLPSLMRPGLTIVISPLIALMKDQVDSLKTLGIRAELINSSLSFDAQASVMRCMESQELDLV